MALQTLICYNTEITSLKGIENLTNLNILECYDTKIPSDEEELVSNLPELRKHLIKKYTFGGDDSFNMIY